MSYLTRPLFTFGIVIVEPDTVVKMDIGILDVVVLYLQVILVVLAEVMALEVAFVLVAAFGDVVFVIVPCLNVLVCFQLLPFDHMILVVCIHFALSCRIIYI